MKFPRWLVYPGIESFQRGKVGCIVPDEVQRVPGSDQRHRDDKDVAARDDKLKLLPELGSELFPELVTLGGNTAHKARVSISGNLVEARERPTEPASSAGVALRSHNAAALETLRSNRDHIPEGLHRVLIECLSYLSRYRQVGLKHKRGSANCGVRSCKIHPLPDLYEGRLPAEWQLQAIPAQLLVSGIFQLGIEISGPILRNHPGKKVCGGNSRSAPCWQKFA